MEIILIESYQYLSILLTIAYKFPQNIIFQLKIIGSTNY